MPKINSKHKNQQPKNDRHKINLEEEVMSKITSGQVKMKPKWFFVVGSLLMIVGLASLTVSAIFLVSLTIFLIRRQGPGYGRLEMMLTTFPWWVPILAVLGVVFGILLLKKYDFSYRKNFFLIVVVFISSIIVASLAIDYLGLNNIWSRREPMRRFYQHFENQEYSYPKGQGSMQYNHNGNWQLEKN